MDTATLTHPEHLWALALLPLLLWLSRPVRPRVVEATPHLAQWLRARDRLRRRPVRFPWRRLLLLLLAFSACVLAWAEPRIGRRPGPSELVVVLDTSASMAAGGERSAWQQACAAVRQQLAELPGGVGARLVLAGDGMRVCRGSAAELGAALPVAPFGAGSVDLAALAEQLAADPQRAVWTVTDGLGRRPAPAEGALTLVGQPRPNAGIVGLQVVDGWPLPDVSVQLSVAADLDAEVPLRLVAEGGVEPVDPVSLEAHRGHPWSGSLELRRTGGGTLRITLQGAGDAFAADDAVEIELPGPPSPDIAVRCDSEAGPAIQAAARTLAEETGGRVLEAAEAERAGFLLVEGGILSTKPGSMRFLTFGTRPPGPPLGPDDVVAAPAVRDWDRSDPLTRGLDLSELEITSCLRRDFLGSGKAVVTADHGPLVVVDEGPEAASVHVSFRLSDSNLALLPAFPQFLRRCFARSYLDRAVPRPSPGNLTSPAESDLRRPAGAPAADRSLPPFGRPGASLVVPLLALALLAIAVRVYA